MTIGRYSILAALVVGAAVMTTGIAHAAFVEIDDFDGLVPGPIANQNEWHAHDLTSVVDLDPADPDNQVLDVLTASTFLFHPAVVPEGATRMMFVRFRYEDQLSVSFGMAQSLFPDQFGNFDVELSLTSTKDDLRINDDGTYLVLTTLEPGQWYNCWLLIDNKADVTSVWLHDRPYEGATAEDQLEVDGRTEFPFRGGVLYDLKNFFIKTGGGDGVSGPLILDDIYLQNTDAVDLSYPQGGVAGVAAPPARMSLGGAWPNPFNPQTTISFTLDEPQTIELAVHDLRGRLVRSLGAGLREAGPHAVPWDGRDQTGADVASGIYLIRLSSRTELRTGKLVLAR